MFLRTFLPLLLTALAATAATVERLPPSDYSAKAPAYLYYKTLTITRKGPTQYAFEVVLQGDLPAEASRELGVQYNIEVKARPIPAKPLFNTTPTPTPEPPSILLSIQRKPDQTRFEVSNAGTGLSTVDLLGLSSTGTGFSFILQSSSFNTPRPPTFTLSSSVLTRSGGAGKLNASPCQQAPLAISEDAPSEVLETSGGAKLGSPPASALTVDPQKPAQLLYTAPAAPPQPHRPAPFGGVQFPVSIKSVTLLHRPDSLDLDVTLQDDLPSPFPPTAGLRFTCLFDFFDPTVRARESQRAVASLTLDLGQGKDTPSWTEGEIQLHGQVFKLKAANFLLKKDGFIVSFASDIFRENYLARFDLVPIRLNQGMSNSGHFLESPCPDTGLLAIPTALDTSTPRPVVAQPSPSPSAPTDPPGQITFDATTQAAPSPTPPGLGRPLPTINPNSLPPYLVIRKVVINHRPGALDLALTLKAPPPAEFPKGQGARYTFFFEFGNEKAQTEEEKMHEDFRGVSTVVVQKTSAAAKFDWASSPMKYHSRNANLTVQAVKLTPEGLSLTLTSLVFEQDVASRVRITFSPLYQVTSHTFDEQKGGPVIGPIPVPFPAQTVKPGSFDPILKR